MKEKDIQYFRQLLTNWLNELDRRADDTVFNLRNSRECLTDLLDQASFDANQMFTLRIRNRERNLVGKIQLALERIEEGEYGICEACGEDIAINRMIARPVTTHCIECKTRMEVLERHHMAVTHSKML